MKEIPCKQCIVQSVCTQRCDEIIKYRYEMVKHIIDKEYDEKYQEYLIYNSDIFERKFKRDKVK
jgi:hypothetical protein